MNCWPEAERPQAIREALQQIEAEIPRLRRYARYLGHEPDHADDLVREGLVRAVAEIPTAIAKIHTGPPGTALRGWLFAILRSCHIEETRRGQRPDAPASTREASSPTTRRNQEAIPAQSELCDAYLSLSEERREVLLLVAIEGLQHEEAGAILGVPLGAVRSRLSQGRQALRQALEAGRTALASPPRLLDNSTGARMRA
jgi:RNA polymerase sigma-70 factor (ECF subfamily)